jgi:hypothetical protein
MKESIDIKIHEGIDIAASAGMKQGKKMEVIAQNLANVNSTGYKKDRLALPPFPPDAGMEASKNALFNLDYASIYNDPYRHFIIDNILDIDFLRSLQEEIREIFNLSAENEDIKTYTSERFDKSSLPGLATYVSGTRFNDGLAVKHLLSFAKKDGSLENILNYISQQETQEKLYRLLVPRTIRRPFSLRPLKIHSQHSKVGLLEFLIYKNCYVSITLCAYENNSGLFQHVDHAHKVTALLLYLGNSDGIERKSGGIQVYKVAKDKQKWSNKNFPYLDYVEETNLSLIKNVSPLSNRLFGFKPSRISWHGVAPMKLPKDVRRESLAINLMKSYNFSGCALPWLFKLKQQIRLRSRIKKFFSI